MSHSVIFFNCKVTTLFNNLKIFLNPGQPIFGGTILVL